MLKFAGLLALHLACIFFLWQLWKDKNKAEKRGGVFTKMGYVSRTKSPRLSRFSIWVDFLFLLILYVLLILYSVWLLSNRLSF